MLGLVRLPIANRFSGDAVSGATVTVYRTGTTVAPTLYADALGVTALGSNVLTADPNGEVRFWVAGPVDLVVSGTGITTRTVRVDPVVRVGAKRRLLGVSGGSVDGRQFGGYIITAAQVTRVGNTFTASLGGTHLMATGMTVKVGCRVRELRTDEVPVTVVDGTTISYPATYPASGNSIPANTQVTVFIPSRWSPESWARKTLMHPQLAGRWDVVGLAVNPGDNWPQISERTDEILALAARCDVIVGSLGRDFNGGLNNDGQAVLPLPRLLRQIRDLGCDFIEAEWKPIDTGKGAPGGDAALDLIERGRSVLLSESRETDGLEVIDWIQAYGNPAATDGNALAGTHCERAHLNADGADLAAEPFIGALIRRSPGEPRALRSWRADVWDSGGRVPIGANALVGLTSDAPTQAISGTLPSGTGGTINIAAGSVRETAFALRGNGSGTIRTSLLAWRQSAFRAQELQLVNPTNGNLDITLDWIGPGSLTLSNGLRVGDVLDVGAMYSLTELNNLASFEVYMDQGQGAVMLGAGLWWGSSFTQASLADQRMTRAEGGTLMFPRRVVLPSSFVPGTTPLSLSFRLRFGNVAGGARLRVFNGQVRVEATS